MLCFVSTIVCESDKVKELIYSFGVLKFYIIIDLKWEDFKDIIFRRREPEVENFSKNESYFKSISNVYIKYLVDIYEVYGVNHLIVDASLWITN